MGREHGDSIFVPLSQMPDSWQTAIWSTHTARRSYRSSCGIPPGNLNQRMSACYRQQASRTICSSTTVCTYINAVYIGIICYSRPTPTLHGNPSPPSQLLWTKIGYMRIGWLPPTTRHTIGHGSKVGVYVRNSDGIFLVFVHYHGSRIFRSACRTRSHLKNQPKTQKLRVWDLNSLELLPFW